MIGTDLPYQDEYRVFRIRDGEDHWYVEITLANTLHRHTTDVTGHRFVESYLEDMGPVDVSIVPPHVLIPIAGDDGTTKIKPARLWALEVRGLLASTCE